MSSSRGTTRPGRRASSCSRSNSLRDRPSSLPVRQARRAAASIRRSPSAYAAGGGVAEGALPAQHSPDARDDLGTRERLDHVVVRADLEAHDAVHLGAAGGEHDDRDLRRAAQGAAHVAAVAVRQREVEEHKVGRGGLEALERLRGRERRDDVEAVPGQGARERLGDGRLVLDEEDARAGAHGSTVPRRDPRFEGVLRRFHLGFTEACRLVVRAGRTIAATRHRRARAMRPTPIQIAAGFALLGAGGVAGAALPVAAQRPAAVAVAPAPVEVRTQVVHRTVRVVRHERPKHLRPRRAAAPAPAQRPAAPSAAPAPAPAAAAPATAATGRPLVTRSSGTAAHRSGSGAAADPVELDRRPRPRGRRRARARERGRSR